MTPGAGIPIRPVSLWCAGREVGLAEVVTPLDLDLLVPGAGPWEVEIGFGKGRFLLQSADARPDRRFLGLEVASKYYRIVRHRAGRRGLRNLLLLRGDALYLLAAVLPAGFASAVHVYFPDPWPKKRHHKRRLFDPTTVDLVLGLLAAGGRLWVATDHEEYGLRVREVLETHPAVELEESPSSWPGGPRTNYEAKYVAQGRPILRLVARRRPGELLHPAGCPGVVAALAARGDSDEEAPG